MKFLNKYDYETLEDGSILLKMKPSKIYRDIFICVRSYDEDVIIYDAGSIMKSLYNDYNFKDEEYLSFLEKLCAEYNVVKENTFFVTRGKKEDAEKLLSRFIEFIDDITTI